MIVQIENTNLCNANCWFCGRKYMTRPVSFMEQSIFERIIDECKNLNIDGIYLTGLGEPLLDPLIVDRVKLIKNKLNVPITIYTNGTNLHRYVEKLVEFGVSEIYISLNAISPEKRMSVMNIDNFEYIDNIILNWNYKCKLWVSFIPDIGLMERGDCELAISRYNNENVSVFFHYASNWAGKIFDLKYKPTRACSRPFNFIHILNDGRVVLCCLDINGEIVLGNSIREAVNNEKLSYYKKMMIIGKRYELDLCKNCATV